MKLVLIQFDDITSDNVNWVSRDDIGQDIPSNCVACGILIDETGKYLTLNLMLSPRNYSQTCTIPKGCIKKMWKLKVD